MEAKIEKASESVPSKDIFSDNSQASEPVKVGEWQQRPQMKYYRLAKDIKERQMIKRFSVKSANSYVRKEGGITLRPKRKWKCLEKYRFELGLQGVDETIKLLPHGIRSSMKTLKELSFDSSLCEKITSGGFLIFSNLLGKNFRRIQRLTLTFIGCPNVNGQEISTILMKVRKNFKELKQLAICCDQCTKIDDQGVSKFAKEIGKFIHLEKLVLGFDGIPELSDDGIIGLMTQIGGNLKQLNDLRLDCNICPKITSAGVSSLAIQLGSHLTQLKQLTLKFEHCREITDGGIQVLSTQIRNNLKQLKKSTFAFDTTSLTSSGRAVLKELEKLNS